MTGINNLRALLIHRFFYPDSPPYAVILKHMSQEFINSGYVVDILSSKPSYKSQDMRKQERYKTIVSKSLKIFRLPVFKLHFMKINKLFNYFWFPLAVFVWMFFGKKYSVVTVSTSPPVILPFFVALVCRIRGYQLVYHCMDIHPEIGRISGEFKNKYVYKLLQWMDNFTCDSANKIIVLSTDMKNTLINRRSDYKKNNIVIINNYELPSEDCIEALDKTLLKRKNIRRVVFTGNIGRYQNLHSFVDALLLNEQIEDFELIFVGEGTALASLKKISEPLKTMVKFIPHQSVRVAKEIIRDADLAIVSLSEGVIEHAYPSKTMTYLSQGTPILLSVESGNELSDLVTDNALGFKVMPSNTDEIYKAYSQLCENPKAILRESVKQVYQENFSIEVFDKKLNIIIKELKMNENEV